MTHGVSEYRCIMSLLSEICTGWLTTALQLLMFEFLTLETAPRVRDKQPDPKHAETCSDLLWKGRSHRGQLLIYFLNGYTVEVKTSDHSLANIEEYVVFHLSLYFGCVIQRYFHITKKRGWGLTTSWTFSNIGQDDLTRFRLLSILRACEGPGRFGSTVLADSKVSAATMEVAMSFWGTTSRVIQVVSTTCGPVNPPDGKPHMTLDMATFSWGSARREVIAASGNRKVPILNSGPHEHNRSFLKVGYPVIVIPEALILRYYNRRTFIQELNCKGIQMSVPELIRKKRDGEELTDDELHSFVTGVTDGTVQDCQAGAMLMAMYIRGMSNTEAANLTKHMAQSGDLLTWDPLWNDLLVDKHSTGGVGDKEIFDHQLDKVKDNLTETVDKFKDNLTETVNKTSQTVEQKRQQL
uniref:Glycosyl transferase family 3 N-terminal domain-containing protein n=1 Tax=Timema cristinae TaxID=61476 RepID=A0A7R9CUA5_TIMCR|nr:unnamed protein product [Timema cristinae]